MEEGLGAGQARADSSNPTETARHVNADDDHITLPEAFSELSMQRSENPSSSWVPALTILDPR